MAAATHSGHCQACGRLQKLPFRGAGRRARRSPVGLLSLHGYNVAHGFFSGVCVGAGELPFEVSCDLVAQFIEAAKRRLRAVEEEQATLRTERTTTAWMHIYYREEGWGKKSTYKWERVEFTSRFKLYRDAKDETEGHLVYSFVDAAGRVHGDGSPHNDVRGLQRWDRPETTDAELLIETAMAENAAYAGRVLEREAESLRRYIAWQTERVRTWKPAPLLPVDAKDKEGFAVDAA